MQLPKNVVAAIQIAVKTIINITHQYFQSQQYNQLMVEQLQKVHQQEQKILFFVLKEYKQMHKQLTRTDNWHQNTPLKVNSAT